MTDPNIVICKCGQWNRLPSDKSVQFSCQKCGKPLAASSDNLSQAQERGGQLKRNLASGILLIVVVGGLIFLGQLAAPSTPSPGRSVSKQNPPTASAGVPPRSHDREARQRTVVSEIPAAATDEIPPTAQSAPPSSKVAQPTNKASGIELILPAPGCPEKVPTYESVSAMCKGLEEKACSSNTLCSWSKGSTATSGKQYPAQCYPAHGTYVPIADPAEVARLGLVPPPDPGVFTTVQADRYVSKGNTFADTGQFGKAIVEYTKALKDLPDDVPALAARALAYEKKGEKTHAIADYCKLIVATSSYHYRKSAVEAVARLTQQRTAGSLTESRVPTGSETKIASQSPPTSMLEKSHRKNAIASLIIETEPGADYLIKLVNAANEKDQIVIYVKGGETYSTKVPLGGYRIRAATGETWYGRNDLFGPDTHFFRLRGESPVFYFRQAGRTIHGMKLRLGKVIGGNMEEEKISRSEF
jgi:hypothetical protein